MLGFTLLLGPFPLHYSIPMSSRQSQASLLIVVVYMGKHMWKFLHWKWEVAFITWPKSLVQRGTEFFEIPQILNFKFSSKCYPAAPLFSAQ